MEDNPGSTPISPTYSSASSSLVPLETAQTMAEQAAIKAISSLKKKEKIEKFDEDIDLDSQMRKLFYNKLSQPSLGEMISRQIDEGVATSFVQRLMPGMFTEVEKTNRGGAAGFIMDILNSQFAYGAGQTMGASMSDIIKSLGKENVNRIIGAYQQKMGVLPEGQQEQSELSPEEKQKRLETTIMSLDSSDVNQVTEFMKATGIRDYSDAQKAILMEQDRILQGRGIGKYKPQEVAVAPPAVQVQERKGRQEPHDINRQLMNEFEGNPVGSENLSGRPVFFDTSPSNVVPFGAPGNDANTGLILSLNPDDPQDLQKYKAFKGISGVDDSTVQKMLIKEQKKLRENPQNIEPVSTGDKWNQEDIGRPSSEHAINQPVEQILPDNPSDTIKKPDFYKEIGLNQKPNQQSVSDPINNIMTMLTKLGDNFNNSMKLMSDKIELLENEVVVLKKTNFTPPGTSEIFMMPLTNVPIDIPIENGFIDETDQKEEQETPTESIKLETISLEKIETESEKKGEDTEENTEENIEDNPENNTEDDWWSERNDIVKPKGKNKNSKRFVIK